MKKIDIQINKAKIISFDVELKDDMPAVSARIGLYAGEKRISTFSLRTEDYYSDSIQFDLPARMISPILDIAKELETILVREANKSLMQLSAPKK